jgi:DNA-binding IclR family transcriptional regulator
MGETNKDARPKLDTTALRVGSGVTAALGVLELLAASDAALSLGAMAARLGASKATVARVVDALVASGYVARHPSGRTYAIDYGVLTLAGDVLKRLVLRRRAAPHLHRLAARTGLVCFLGVLWRRQTVVLDRVAPQLLHEQVLDIGKHVPMHGSSMA